ncbi:DUF4397 domain-containing protein [uncultured Marinobacter sp.]|uniref:DUF4397 domain-containing protein n=1 Tax=uncultured Marinobacter sp. TaxID=187379 RepID=UPI0030D881C2
MIRYLALPIVVSGALALSGCFSSSSSSDPTSTVRVIHASADAPPVNVTVNGTNAIEGADYKQAAVLRPTVGTYDIGVDAILPGGDVLTAIGPASLTFEEGVRYDVIAVGSVAGETLEPLILEDEGPAFSSATDFRLRVGHLAPDAPEVDVYLTASETDLGDAEPALTFEYKDVITAGEIPAGDDYRIRVTAGGNLVFDSGQIALPAGADIFVGAVPNTGANADASPISLMAVIGGDVIEFFDVNQDAGVRVVHASADAPAVDILIDDMEAISALEFPDFVPTGRFDDYVSLPAGDINVKVAAAADNSVVPIEADLPLVNAQGYTVMAIGLLGGTPEIQPLVLTDEGRRIATQASLQIVHASTVAGNVDIYLLPAEQTEIGNAVPALSDVPFGASTGYLAIPEGTYNVRVTPAGGGNAAISADGVTVNAGGVYTVIARDGVENAESTIDDLGLILLDDFVPDEV